MDYRQSTTTVDTAIQAYLDFKTATSWRSGSSSAKSVRSTLRVFSRTLQEQIGRTPLTTDLNSLTIARAINACWEEDPNKYTYLGQHTRIKTFIKWLRYHNYALGEVEIFIATVPKKGKPETQRINQDDMWKAFHAIYDYDPRSAWLVRLGYVLSLRGGEMVALKVRDILPADRGAPYGHLRWPSIKQGVGYVKRRLTSEEREVLDAWLGEYEKLIGHKPEADYYLFPGAWLGRYVNGKPALRYYPDRQIKDFHALWRRAYMAAGIYRRWMGSHAGRRGSLTDEFYELERAGVPDPLQHLQRKVKHADRKTTAGYIGLEEGDKETFEVRQRLADIRAGKVSAPQEPETPMSGIRESGDESSETLAKVIQLPFGRRGA